MYGKKLYDEFDGEISKPKFEEIYKILAENGAGKKFGSCMHKRTRFH